MRWNSDKARQGVGARFLDEIGGLTPDGSGAGVTRIAYDEGEQIAHDVFARMAAELGAVVERDSAGNTFATMPGGNPALPRVITGSHLDSVRQGGNFDGAAGVAAGLAALERAAADPGPRGLTVIAFRGEESCWFPHSYIGSRMALGRLGHLVDVLRRTDTRRTLAEHIDISGFDAAGVRQGRSLLDPASIDCFIEVHIEQGPVLDNAETAVGVVTAIAGGKRYRNMVIRGEWAHAGGVPRKFRRDALAAAASFIGQVNDLWKTYDEAGKFVLVTFGTIATEPNLHAFSRIPGQVDLTMDLRFTSPRIMAEFEGEVLDIIKEIEELHKVEIELGENSGPPIIELSSTLAEETRNNLKRRNVEYLDMPSGAGHDTVAFAEIGVPSTMIFVRNQNGSHNPDEGMRVEDFEIACTALMDLVDSRRKSIEATSA